jgi:hypothetical protein
MTKPIYTQIPFSWKPANPEQNGNDQRWLESTVRNAAPFSDWWTKARIVQLAYPSPVGRKVPKTAGLPTYQGLTETEIVEALRSCCDIDQYPEFASQVNRDYVVKTLNAWKSYRFAQAIARNFEVYADREYNNVFLVVSTAPVSPNVDRVLPPMNRFRPLFNVDELATLIQQRDMKRLTLRTHGYANPARIFYDFFVDEAEALHIPDPQTEARTLQEDHLYIGYHWPSEQPITSPGLWQDYWHYPAILLKFLFVLSGISGIIGTLLYFFLRLIAIPLLLALETIPGIAEIWQAVRFEAVAALSIRWHWLIPTVFMLWLLAFLLLRIVVYQRDRYRAIHYGAPDLAEFFWRLDTGLNALNSSSAHPEAIMPNPIEEQKPLAGLRLKVNLVGHSMGGLLLVNVVRILSERGKELGGTLEPDSNLSWDTDKFDDIGDHLELDHLILASPDIPLEFMREGRNNYVRAAMRRCRRIYLMSSDRDTILRYLSAIGNWFTEPSIHMAGMRLGNVYLKPFPNDPEDPIAPTSAS